MQVRLSNSDQKTRKSSGSIKGNKKANPKGGPAKLCINETKTTKNERIKKRKDQENPIRKGTRPLKMKKTSPIAKAKTGS